jgi:chromosomal replication initiator protein
MNLWERIKQILEAKLSAESFQNWFSKTSLIQKEGDRLLVSVPNEETRRWLETEYGERIQAILRDLGASGTSIAYAVRGANGSGSPLQSSAAYDPELDPPAALLNRKFTFDSFVVGACNQFAHAAAHSVATTPSRSYNPLFIYGGVGMGKTHLMHAIGHELLRKFGGMRIVYTSSERFTNEVVNSVRNNRMPSLHQKYRSADVLLVDDIQLLGNKERTQEEFFFTFNELHEHQKQIVISSDAPPKEIPGLLERLRSRFEWGLMADIQPPDLETKMAILDKKAEIEGIHLPEDVRTFMATKTKSNVRELEGGLIKLMAYASLTGSTITLPMAHQVLKHLVYAQERRVTIDAIQKAVAERYRMKQSELKEKSNRKGIVEPRQIAMYLVKELTNASLPEIGRAFGGKHHTTVIHSIRKIAKRRAIDPDLNRSIHSLMDTLQ